MQLTEEFKEQTHLLNLARSCAVDIHRFYCLTSLCALEGLCKRISCRVADLKEQQAALDKCDDPAIRSQILRNELSELKNEILETEASFLEAKESVLTINKDVRCIASNISAREKEIESYEVEARIVKKELDHALSFELPLCQEKIIECNTAISKVCTKYELLLKLKILYRIRAF